MKKEEKKIPYEVPTLKVVEIEVESGFATSAQSCPGIGGNETIHMMFNDEGNNSPFERFNQSNESMFS